MVCYICGKPASFRCPVCERYVCSEHTLRDISRLICSKCFDLARQKEREEQQDKYYHIHHCDFHKCYHDDKYLESQRLHSVSSIYHCVSSDIIYCKVCGKQGCTDSTIKGETKEFKGGDPYTCADYDIPKWLKVTKYLCPICGNAIFFEVDIYREDLKKWWCFSTPYKYYTTVSVGKYSYNFQWKEWVLNTYFRKILNWEKHNIDT